MAKRRASKRLTAAERTKIIATAEAKGLTAEQVERKFGISKWTYYGWRKVSASKMSRGGRGGRGGRGTGTAPTAKAIRSQIEAMLPTMVRDEVTRTLATLFAGGRGGRRRK